MNSKLRQLIPSKVNDSFSKAEIFVGYNADDTVIQLTYIIDTETFEQLGAKNSTLKQRRERRDQLWLGNCLEYFVEVLGSTAYVELNFSLNGDWNAFYFSSYREGKTETQDIKLQTFKRTIHEEFVKFSITLNSCLKEKIGEGHGTAILFEKATPNYFNTLGDLAAKPDFHLFS